MCVPEGKRGAGGSGGGEEGGGGIDDKAAEGVRREASWKAGRHGIRWAGRGRVRQEEVAATLSAATISISSGCP